MKLVENGLSLALLNQLFRLDVETGLIYWRHRPVSHFRDGKVKTAIQIANKINSQHAGKVAFTSKHQLGYLRAEVSGKLLQAHRVAFALFHGRWPEHEVDHINGNPPDNRPSNLRDVTHTENMRNSALRLDNKSGVAGVRWDSKLKRWVSQIRIAGRNRSRTFTSLDAAVNNRKSNLQKLGFHENHGRKSA